MDEPACVDVSQSTDQPAKAVGEERRREAVPVRGLQHPTTAPVTHEGRLHGQRGGPFAHSARKDGEHAWMSQFTPPQDQGILRWGVRGAGRDASGTEPRTLSSIA